MGLLIAALSLFRKDAIFTSFSLLRLRGGGRGESGAGEDKSVWDLWMTGKEAASFFWSRIPDDLDLAHRFLSLTHIHKHNIHHTTSVTAFQCQKIFLSCSVFFCVALPSLWLSGADTSRDCLMSAKTDLR